MKNKLIYIVVALFLIGGIFGFSYYKKVFGKTVIKDAEIFIPTNSNLDEVSKLISNVVENTSDFTFVAGLKKYNKPKAGRYLLKKGMTTNALVNLLRSGNQVAVKVTFNNQDSLEKLAGRIAQQIETDSVSLLTAMTDISFLKKQNLDKRSALAMYIPNQYEFYWNTSPEKFRDKMLSYYNKFWNKNRTAKAEKLGLTKNQVSTLASIVQKETAKVSERPTVAGLYLNRYKSGWALQADPTVIYALKEKNGQDFIVKRVLNKDLEIDSPYNTYKNVGLPPSPIGMPDISAIDAVLNPEQHQYYYMCASVDKIGFHDFAKTLAQHNRNAAKYQRWISKQGIKR
ncbi:endolytic transglycosylase MltG [Tenacibaculum sp. M341]|uniref:endolytic transglycosylase MltG n=1 Tax=Tenacibaculum sp. M341 TaxID=2530339 RepID=UPI00104E3E72|nr:endolytic transglycosylase MltG [Tenacibaculum sp. M341]TCI95108.1 endolytic transglycosylase MltG [Tenacibaculum sp. M341]